MKDLVPVMSDLASDLVIDPRPLSIGRDFEVDTGTHRGQPVVVKVARGDSDTPAGEAQLEAEAAVLARLANSGVVPALVGLTRLPGGRLALVRGWVEGLSLATLIEPALVRPRWQGARRRNQPPGPAPRHSHPRSGCAVPVAPKTPAARHRP